MVRPGVIATDSGPNHFRLYGKAQRNVLGECSAGDRAALGRGEPGHVYGGRCQAVGRGAVGVASLERTAYPRFKRLISERELREYFTPSAEETGS